MGFYTIPHSPIRPTGRIALRADTRREERAMAGIILSLCRVVKRGMYTRNRSFGWEQQRDDTDGIGFDSGKGVISHLG